ncbi:hypothetical protein [Paenibacillus tepidiphilus]|uniref:hypothetical protein n=1 Tax=Paenibacillus tepidiphilus TaxID=2608683 RepID=UPI00123AFADC|nr:hypothetical protein [Paenibacillus tepidiphilus]
MRHFLRMFILTGLTLLLITACSSDTLDYNYTYTGGSESWSAEYIQKASEKPVKRNGKDMYYERSQSYTFELQYKGSPADLEAIQQFKYGFKTTGSSMTQTLDGPPDADLMKIEGKNLSILREDASISVTVEWDGKQEQFELQLKK